MTIKRYFCNFFMYTILPACIFFGAVMQLHAAGDNKKNSGSNDKPVFIQEDFSTLSAILQKYQGKVVYITYWAGWSESCLEQMQASKQLHTKFDSNEIVFLYLGVRLHEGEWKQAVREHIPRGKHALLDMDTERDIYRQTGWRGAIPRYMVAGRNGEMLDKDAPWPDSPDIHQYLGYFLREQ